MKAAKKRLDQLLVERNLCDTRSRARAVVLAGKVRSGTEVLDKPGKEYPADLPLRVIEPPRFVGRAGEKLDAFLEIAGLDPHGATVLDVGASTGGFTDCLLQRGARHSTCVDVGRGQLHAKLRGDARVENRERLHVDRIPETDLPFAEYDWVVVDLSFISLRRALPPVWPRVRDGGLLVCLVKPQFEATRGEADRGRGVIRDPAIRARVLGDVLDFAARELPGCALLRTEPSAVAGTDGNREFLAAFRKEAGPAGETPF